MDQLSNLALIAQMIDSAEKNIQSAKQLVSEGGKVIEGAFDGQNMIGPDNKQYPVPANYASKSKLVQGDVLKLTIADDGSFIYKQINPIERKKMLGILSLDDKGDFRVLAEGKIYRVLLASLTYFKAEPNDEVTIIVPKDSDSEWAAVENVIKKSSSQHAVDMEMGDSSSSRRVMMDEDEEL
jgi:hypothetical protein